MPRSVTWQGAEGDDWDVEIDAAPVYSQSHWFCHGCKAHFGLPVYDVKDPGMIFRCPACGSIEIEEEEPTRP